MRYFGLLIMFLSSLIFGIFIIYTFPTNVNCPPSFEVQGLGILFIILSCCTCTQAGCYWYDAREVVHRTSTQEVGDLRLTVTGSSSRGTTNGKEVFGGVDVGHKACSGLSSCWQICGFLSCFGIGLSLMTTINSSGTVISSGNISTSVTSTDCDGETMYAGGLVVVCVSCLFFVTMCWRLCRDPQTMLLYQQHLVPINQHVGMDNREERDDGGEDGGGNNSVTNQTDVELTLH